MTGFVDTLDGVIPIADIASLQFHDRSANTAAYYAVNRVSGRGTAKLLTWHYEDLMARPVQLTTALPGTYLLRAYVDGEGEFLDPHPVLAWAICLDGQTRAVLPSGVNRARLCVPYHPDFVRMPDGAIYELGFEAEPDRFANEDEVRAHLRSKREAHLRSEAADASPASDTAS